MINFEDTNKFDVTINEVILIYTSLRIIVKIPESF